MRRWEKVARGVVSMYMCETVKEQVFKTYFILNYAHMCIHVWCVHGYV